MYTDYWEWNGQTRNEGNWFDGPSYGLKVQPGAGATGFIAIERFPEQERKAWLKSTARELKRYQGRSSHYLIAQNGDAKQSKERER